jgi:iron(III) transport system ATP-binding protein
MKALLEISDLTRQFGALKAVDNASLRLRSGEIACLLGPSGCGKSTLLRIVAGLETLDQGTIVAEGITLSSKSIHIAPELRDFGFVFQDYALFPHLNIEDNIGFGLRHLPKPERKAIVTELLDMVHLGPKAKLYPATLSGGEQQRIALVRALARKPRLILLDEPFSGLDAHLKSEVREATLDVLETSGIAALIVTHDAEEALSMGHSLYLMDKGRIIQQGTPEACYLNPVSIAAARLLGETNIISAMQYEDHLSTGFGDIHKSGATVGVVKLCIRPEAFMVVAPNSNGAKPAIIYESRYHGAYSDLMLEAVDGSKAHAHVSSLHPFTKGETVWIRLEPQLVSVFT